jgi:hypothetical protein
MFAAGSQRPWLNLEEAATELNVSVAVLRTMVNHGKLTARQIAKGVPWMIQREDLNRPAVVTWAKDAKSRNETPLEDKQQVLLYYK